MVGSAPYQAYLYWQKQRGLAYPMPRNEVFQPKKENSAKVVFYDLTLQSVELHDVQALLTKMLQAIQLTIDDVKIQKISKLEDIDSPHSMTCAVFYAADDQRNFSDQFICIPHPADLLRHPQLKRPAWESLKKLAAKLSDAI